MNFFVHLFLLAQAKNFIPLYQLWSVSVSPPQYQLLFPCGSKIKQQTGNLPISSKVKSRIFDTDTNATQRAMEQTIVASQARALRLSCLDFRHTVLGIVFPSHDERHIIVSTQTMQRGADQIRTLDHKYYSCFTSPSFNIPITRNLYHLAIRYTSSYKWSPRSHVKKQRRFLQLSHQSLSR